MAFIIKKPLTTEKNSNLIQKGIFSFQVSRDANKTQIKEQVEKYFGVKVESVRTLICRNRSRRTRFGSGRVKYWKKAFIRLKPGEHISLFEGS